jgi:Uma2 family endonuclease
MSTVESVSPEIAVPPTEIPVAEGAVIPLDRLFHISVAQYDEMADHGILRPHDRLELIEGMLVQKMTKKEPHVGTVLLMEDALRAALGSGWRLVFEQPLVLARSVPEPDVMVLRGQTREYLRKRPDASSAALVVEVSVATYREDQELCRIYAEAGIPIYWIANVPARRIECYTQPSGPGPIPAYSMRVDYQEGQSVPLVLDGRELARLPVAELLAPMR